MESFWSVVVFWLTFMALKPIWGPCKVVIWDVKYRSRDWDLLSSEFDCLRLNSSGFLTQRSFCEEICAFRIGVFYTSFEVDSNCYYEEGLINRAYTSFTVWSTEGLGLVKSPKFMIWAMEVPDKLISPAGRFGINSFSKEPLTAIFAVFTTWEGCDLRLFSARRVFYCQN